MVTSIYKISINQLDTNVNTYNVFLNKKLIGVLRSANNKLISSANEYAKEYLAKQFGIEAAKCIAIEVESVNFIKYNAKQYNAAIMKLYRHAIASNELTTDNIDTEIPKIESKIRFLYDYDSEFRLISKQSLIALMHLNSRYRAIPLHSFGLFAFGLFETKQK